MRLTFEQIETIWDTIMSPDYVTLHEGVRYGESIIVAVFNDDEETKINILSNGEIE